MIAIADLYKKSELALAAYADFSGQTIYQQALQDAGMSRWQFNRWLKGRWLPRLLRIKRPTALSQHRPR